MSDVRAFRLTHGQELFVCRFRSTVTKQSYYGFTVRSRQRGGQIASFVTDENPRFSLNHDQRYDAPGTVKMQADGFFVHLPTAQAKKLGEFLGVAITEQIL